MMDLRNKLIGVFGMGKSGLAALEFLYKKQARVFAVDQGEYESWKNKDTIKNISRDIPCFSEKEAVTLFSQCSLIILSPGIPRNHRSLALAAEKKVPIWSEIELSSRFTNIPILAITGTNGKTTVVSLIKEILHRANIPVFVGGNIGIPFCRFLLDKNPAKLAVLELSSFQLESMEKFHPHVAVILNIYPNHGERYENLFDYKRVKLQIAKNMESTDHLLHPNDLALPEDYKVSPHIFNSFDHSKLQIQLDKFDLSRFKPIGQHNLFNLYIAIKSLELFLGKSDKIQRSVQSTIDSFCGIPHRLQRLDSPYTFIPFNDAKNSNWDGVISAIDSINTRPLCVILGGKKRGRGDSIAPYIDYFQKKVDKILLIGEVADQLAEELPKTMDYEICGTLAQAVKKVKKYQWPGVLLFSPAFPSFDQFNNFKERGDTFIQMVKD
ncbi:MAG: UDP-N-acetylmuramoyl-L-alanine--D-glutamate ligase [Halobacteriovoraceae bacterium]|nr:UDP-N-acetylmuramoyl-L-alanine--D-glutamate ligase [Halobacteriovoraceae bacterium]